MKNNIVNWVLGGMVLLACGSCNDSEYEIANLFPEKYHKILSIRNSGEQATTLYSTGNDMSVPVSVMKTGSDVNATAQATIKVLSKEEINAKLGTEENPYTPIPSNLYTLVNEELTFSSEDRWKKAEVVFSPEGVEEVKQLLANNTEGSITLDCSGLEYISSMGLRVLLKLRKKSGQYVKLENVSPAVMSILSMTGFSQLLEVSGGSNS